MLHQQDLSRVRCIVPVAGGKAGGSALRGVPNLQTGSGDAQWEERWRPTAEGTTRFWLRQCRGLSALEVWLLVNIGEQAQWAGTENALQQQHRLEG